MPTYIARQKRTRVIYVVLLCIAIAMSTWAIYNQVHSDSTSAQFADQITAFCADNPAYSNEHFNCQQAKSVQDNGGAVIAGPKGEKGDKGDRGERGYQGEPGQSITGPPGVPGATGDRGMNGNPGIDGRTVVGPPGPEGPQGAKGDKGDKGDQGERGADGQPGEDAPHPVSQKFASGGSGCELQTTYSDGTVLSASAPEVMCI